LDGADRRIPIKLPGRVTYSDVTLSRGTSGDFDFHNWALDTTDASRGRGRTSGGEGLASPLFKTDHLTVVQRDRDNSTRRRWRLSGAYPKAYVAGDWDNNADEVVIEQLILRYDYFEPV